MVNRTLKTTALLTMLALPLYAARARVDRAQMNGADPSLSASSSSSIFPEHLFEGRGVARTDYNDCVADLPILTKAIAAKGFKLTETATCSPVEGQVENYAPSFRAWAPRKVELRQVTGSNYNSEAICDSVAEKMGAELARKEIVLEVGCTGTKGLSQVTSDDLVFQPVAVVVDNLP